MCRAGGGCAVCHRSWGGRDRRTFHVRPPPPPGNPVCGTACGGKPDLRDSGAGRDLLYGWKSGLQVRNRRHARYTPPLLRQGGDWAVRPRLGGPPPGKHSDHPDRDEKAWPADGKGVGEHPWDRKYQFSQHPDCAGWDDPRGSADPGAEGRGCRIRRRAGLCGSSILLLTPPFP